MSTSTYIIGNSKELKEIFLKNKLSTPNLIISSPPYYDVLNYDNNDSQIGLHSEDYPSYLNEVADIYQDCYDLSAPSASLWMVIDTFKRNGALKLLPFDLVNKLQSKSKETWVLKEVIIWDKEKSLPWNSKGRFKNQFEYILYFTKGKEFHFNLDPLREILDLKKWWKTYPERYNAGGKAPSNIWSFTTPIRGWGNGLQNHLCPLPFQLAERIISVASKEGDTVFDPFAGSGTLLALAQIMNRVAIGVDINTSYKELFDKEVKVGAKRYWNARTKDLATHQNLLSDFKELISKLRKQKFGYLLTSILSKSYPAVDYVIMCEDAVDKVRFFVLTEHLIDVKILLENDDVSEYLRQSKISVAIVRQEEMSISVDNLFEYPRKRFYNYSRQIKVKPFKNFVPGHFYSTISVKIID